MSLKTGHKLHWYYWVELPITDEVIDRVEQLAAEQGQPLMENRPIFKWNPGELIVSVDSLPYNGKHLKYIDVFVDNFITLMQGQHNASEVRSILMHAVDAVFRPNDFFDKSNRYKHISIKN